MKSYDVVGYIYNSDIYCSRCILTVVVLTQPVHMSVVLEEAEVGLEKVAKILRVDRSNENTYDSDEFPKVIFADQVGSSDEVCAHCSQPLLEFLGDGWLDTVLD